MSLLCVAQLLDTKSTDRKITLLHYIALIVKEKYPELVNFYNELHFVDKAAAGELTHPDLSVCVCSDVFLRVATEGTTAETPRCLQNDFPIDCNTKINSC